MKKLFAWMLIVGLAVGGFVFVDYVSGECVFCERRTGEVVGISKGFWVDYTTTKNGFEIPIEISHYYFTIKTSLGNVYNDGVSYVEYKNVSLDAPVDIFIIHWKTGITNTTWKEYRFVY